MMMTLQQADLIALDREIAKESLAEFIKMAWHIIEPGIPYIHNWHMDAISEHLMATATSEIIRLLINVPPGTSKSSAAAVFFPAWLWGPAGLENRRFIGASHEVNLAIRDNRKTKMLIESQWYQNRWPIALAKDQNTKDSFENMKRGFRQASAVTSMTGKRGHFVTWDDPHNTEGADSEEQRATTIRIFKETLPTRMVDPRTSVLTTIMQRLNEDDVSGYILANDLGYEHLCLPMEFEPENKCYTSIGFEDPRTEEGELLFEERFPREVVERDKKALGTYAAAGQLQQRPTPRGGALFKAHWFNVVQAAPANYIWARGWDLAGTKKKKSAYTAGVLVGMSRSKPPRFCIANSTRIKGSPNEVEMLVTNTAKSDAAWLGDVHGSLPQDPGQAGIAQKQYLIGALAGFNYRATPEVGDKISRASPVAAQAEAGNVDILSGDWTKEMLDELKLFPKGNYADQVDALSRAFNTLLSLPNFDFYVSGEND